MTIKELESLSIYDIKTYRRGAYRQILKEKKLENNNSMNISNEII